MEQNCVMNKMVLTTLGHTWILDLDGTLVKHNGYKIDGRDSLLPGAEEFLKSIPEKDMVIILTSRTEKYRQKTLNFLKENQVRYDHIIFEAPYGERVLINDRKPSGLDMAVAVNVNRDDNVQLCIDEDDRL